MSSLPRLRVVGLAAGLAVFAALAGFFFLSRGQESSAAASHSIVPLTKRAKPNTPSSTKPSARKRVTKPVSKPAANGLPGSIASALSRNEVVVVSLYAPDVELDDMAMREAKAGAAAAGVGFVALDVFEESQSRPLAEKVGVLKDPAVLVFRRPDVLVVTLTGFADQQTVAQAARNAGL